MSWSLLWRFLLKRLLRLVVSLLVASFVIFAAMYVAPGSAIASLAGGHQLSPATLHVLRVRYHLNQPFFAQYGYWVANALHGNLGLSVTLDSNVSTLIGVRIWTTAGLVLYASILIVVVGIGLGVVAGLRRRGPVDTGIVLTTALFSGVPSFAAAILLILVFAVKIHWFPASANGIGLIDNVRHFTLPAVALAISTLSVVARVTRASVRDEAHREHVQTARSRGIPVAQIVRRHILRNASIPITTITGITIASLIAFAAIIEVAFNLNGIGALLIQSAEEKNFAVVQGISLLLVTAFVVVNLLVDLLYFVLDPRLRLGAGVEAGAR